MVGNEVDAIALDMDKIRETYYKYKQDKARRMNRGLKEGYH